MNAILRLSFAAILFVATSVACNADTLCGESCSGAATWRDMNAIKLSITLPGTPGYAKWDGTFDAGSNDFRLDTEMSDGNAVHKGTILMVSGLVMAVQGNMVAPGRETQLLDGAALSQQLVYRLLDTALPQGPTAIEGVRQIDYTSAENDMLLATTTAAAVVAAPWRVTGQAKKLASGDVDYDLQLASGDASVVTTGAPAEYNPHLVGRLSRLATARLDGSLSLEGWKTYTPPAAEDGTDAIVEAGKPYRNVSEVRMNLAQENGTGVASERDFSGNWKESCEDEFGLHIERAGGDGRYLIAFCGPGGCEDFERARRSFIEGDRNYEVINDNEIVQTGEQGGHQRYLRCMQ